MLSFSLVWGLRGRQEFVGEVKELCSEGIPTLHVKWDDLT